MQPLLVNAMIKFVGSPDSQTTRNKGYGLIGASAIVYLGLAVRAISLTVVRGVLDLCILQTTPVKLRLIDIV